MARKDGIVARKDGQVFAKIFGPVRICQVAITASQVVGKTDIINVNYTINAMSCDYSESSLFATRDAALAQVDLLLATEEKKV